MRPRVFLNHGFYGKKEHEYYKVPEVKTLVSLNCEVVFVFDVIME